MLSKATIVEKRVPIEKRMKEAPRKDKMGIDRLLQLMRDLRDPQKGCPWDLGQTLQSLVPHTIEEAYEVADAVENGSLNDIRDELGDLLLQVVFQAQIAQDDGVFSFDDVAHAVTDKMVRRHPHIYGKAVINSKQEQEVSWERIKLEERKARGLSPERQSLMDDIPPGFPATTRAVKIQKRAASVGFDWPERGPVVDKIHEELVELLQVCDQPQTALQEDRVEQEFGDLLFAVLNLGRHLKLDPEKALRRTNSKFERRFRYVEQAFVEKGQTLSEASLEAMDLEWDRAKERE